MIKKWSKFNEGELYPPTQEELLSELREYFDPLEEITEIQIIDKSERFHYPKFDVKVNTILPLVMFFKSQGDQNRYNYEGAKNNIENLNKILTTINEITHRLENSNNWEIIYIKPRSESSGEIWMLIKRLPE